MSAQRLSTLVTEQINAQHAGLHQISVRDLVSAMNDEDRIVASAVAAESESITALIECVIARLKGGGRLIYLGAGTSGRLGILDASECVPTFNASPDLIQGHIAGGDHALRNSIEGAEDSHSAGENLIKELSIGSNDAVIGITASGRTPFVLGAISEAKTRKAFTGGIACNKNSELSEIAERTIEVEVGPEIIAGSTRLKSGTATKLILNMISTITMIRMGKVYQNLMIDVRVTNQKLRERAENILMHLTNCDRNDAQYAIADADDEVRIALITLLTGVSSSSARKYLIQNDLDLDKTIANLKRNLNED
jgi:N-acetylmuramic acid 6-phosphate etherase